jgi:hypothetical protein
VRFTETFAVDAPAEPIFDYMTNPANVPSGSRP